MAHTRDELPKEYATHHEGEELFVCLFVSDNFIQMDIAVKIRTKHPK